MGFFLLSWLRSFVVLGKVCVLPNYIYTFYIQPARLTHVSSVAPHTYGEVTYPILANPKTHESLSHHIEFHFLDSQATQG